MNILPELADLTIGLFGQLHYIKPDLYRAVDEVEGYPVRSVYSVSDIPDYESYDYRDCPYCKRGVKLDALVNSYGYSTL